MADGFSAMVDAQKAPARRPGRPSTFTQEIADRICEAVATSPLGLKALCDAHSDLPWASTVRTWLEVHAEFKAQYARARETRAELLVDQCLDISDDASSDVGSDKEGNPIANHAAIARAKLRVDTRKWIASKLAPKVYGERQQVDVQGTIGLEHLVLASIHAAQPVQPPAERQLLNVTPAAPDGYEDLL